ncbi:12928_t:CDS:2 [Entrophospora sp. SA101]|nr:14857_t:CDS:2 [Entrophospora sp. SA101]CAJ0831153.1 12928_t:CDS:2 [Entrophospora sp. SA101]
MRRKELSVAQREQIIGAYISGVRQKVISAQLDIPTSTINDTIKLYKETGYATPEKYPGRPKLLTQRDTRTLQRIVHDNRFSPLGDITNKFNFHLNTNLHYNTVRKYLRDEGLEEWGKISIETLDCLILSLPDRAKAVIKAKGGHTKY